MTTKSGKIQGWKIKYIIVLAVLLLIMNLLLLIILLPKKRTFSYTPKEYQEYNIGDCDLCSDDELAKVRNAIETDSDAGYEIMTVSGTISFTSEGTVIGGDQDGKKVPDLAVLVGSHNKRFLLYSETVIDFDDSVEDTSILREGDDVDLEYYKSQFNGDSVLISIHVKRDLDKLNSIEEAERAEAEKEFNQRIAREDLDAAHSIIGTNLVIIVIAMCLLFIISKIAGGDLMLGYKILLITPAVLVSLALTYVLLFCPFISALGEVVEALWIVPSDTVEITLDENGKISESKVIKDDRGNIYTIQYSAFGRDYTALFSSSYFYDCGDTVKVWYNPVFPEHIDIDYTE